MTRAINASGLFLTRVVRRRTPCRAHFEITLAIHEFPPAAPGQFLEVLCRSANDENNSASIAGHRSSGDPLSGVMLRRPFSIAALRRSAQGCEIDLLGRIAGQGTEWLAARTPSDAVDVLGPLGRGFSSPPTDARVLLVAGGIGLPPIRWLGEMLRGQNIACDAIYGAQTRDALPITLLSEPPTDGRLSPCVEEFARHGINTLLTTDDGTCGLRGIVTDGMRRYLNTIADHRPIHVYACGAEGMLRAVARLCAEHRLPCEVAMERKMGCGMGTCQSCVVPVIDHTRESGWRYALCCTDGPVFNAAEVLWPPVAR